MSQSLSGAACLVGLLMRFGLVVVLCLLNAGCAIVRNDTEEPVDNVPRTAKAEPVLKPSEVLEPKIARDREPADRLVLHARHVLSGLGEHRDRARSGAGHARHAAERRGRSRPGRPGRPGPHGIRLPAWRGATTCTSITSSSIVSSQQPLPRDIEFGDFTFRRRHELPHEARLARADAHPHLLVRSSSSASKPDSASAST